jgi:hypothetical protein
VYDFASDKPIDVDQLRIRLRRMSDSELIQFGEAARYMCSPQATHGRPPRESYVIQLREARDEWRRRHPAQRG